MIRLATAEDVPAITAVTLAAYAKWVSLIGREPLPMTVDYARAFIEHRFDLIDEGKELAALIETVPEDGWLLIVNVAVLPAFQRRGHGRCLLAHAERLAAEAGLAGTRLYTTAVSSRTSASMNRSAISMTARRSYRAVSGSICASRLPYSHPVAGELHHRDRSGMPAESRGMRSGA
jgi:GNAT superfamily N-acetyltransferase